MCSAYALDTKGTEREVHALRFICRCGAAEVRAVVAAHIDIGASEAEIGEAKIGEVVQCAALVMRVAFICGGTAESISMLPQHLKGKHRWVWVCIAMLKESIGRREAVFRRNGTF